MFVAVPDTWCEARFRHQKSKRAACQHVWSILVNTLKGVMAAIGGLCKSQVFIPQQYLIFRNVRYMIRATLIYQVRIRKKLGRINTVCHPCCLLRVSYGLLVGCRGGALHREQHERHHPRRHRHGPHHPRRPHLQAHRHRRHPPPHRCGWCARGAPQDFKGLGVYLNDMRVSIMVPFLQDVMSPSLNRLGLIASVATLLWQVLAQAPVLSHPQAIRAFS